MNELELLRNQIEALTAERDEWKARCEFSFEQRERLTIHLDDCMTLDKHRLKSLKAIERELDQLHRQLHQQTAMSERCIEEMNRNADIGEQSGKERDAYAAAADSMAMSHKVERDALKEAARLALDALEEHSRRVVVPSLRIGDAIAALKAVL